MYGMHTDDDDLCYCEPHRLEHCHICCCDFRDMNDATRDRDDVDESSDAISIDDITEDGEEDETFIEPAQQAHGAQLWAQVILPRGNAVPAVTAALPPGEEERLARLALIDQVIQEERHRLMYRRGLSRDQVLGMAAREGAMLIVESNVEARARARARYGLPEAPAMGNETQEERGRALIAVKRERVKVEASDRRRARLPQPGPQMTHVSVNMAQGGGREGGARVDGTVSERVWNEMMHEERGNLFDGGRYDRDAIAQMIEIEEKNMVAFLERLAIMRVRARLARQEEERTAGLTERERQTAVPGHGGLGSAPWW